MTLSRQKRYILPIIASAVLLSSLSSCGEEEVPGRVIPIGENETYIVTDSAIVYTVYNDTASVEVTYRLEADSVIDTQMRLQFQNVQQAEDFFNAYNSDPEIGSVNYEQDFIRLFTSNYNGLRKADIVSILKGTYLYNDSEAPTTLDEPRDFTYSTGTSLRDGMYFIPSRHASDGSSYIFTGSTTKAETISDLSLYGNTRAPWRLWQSDNTHWYIQLSNGRYLRRSGNRLAPLALTTCSTRDMATAWCVSDAITGLNVWSIYKDIARTGDFYGLLCGADNALRLRVNALDTYSMLTCDVCMRFYVKGMVTTSIESYLGCEVTMPDCPTVVEGATFIGWNKEEDQVDGYILPGTVIPADDAEWHAVFVKTE